MNVGGLFGPTMDLEFWLWIRYFTAFADRNWFSKRCDSYSDSGRTSNCSTLRSENYSDVLKTFLWWSFMNLLFSVLYRHHVWSHVMKNVWNLLYLCLQICFRLYYNYISGVVVTNRYPLSPTRNGGRNIKTILDARNVTDKYYSLFDKSLNLFSTKKLDHSPHCHVTILPLFESYHVLYMVIYIHVYV